MRYSEFSEKTIQGAITYIEERWEGLNRLTEEYSTQATRYLFFSNSGGAVAVLSYLGAVEGKPIIPNLKLALGCFTLGVILCLITILCLLHRFDNLLKNWSKGVQSFYSNESHYSDLIKGDNDKSSKIPIAWFTGYTSFLLFLIGIFSSIGPLLVS